MPEIFQFDRVDPEILRDVVELAIRLGLFLVGAILSPIVGRSLPKFLQYLLKISQNYTDINAQEIYKRLIKPFQNSIAITGTLACIALSLYWLIIYNELYTFLGFFIYSALSISIVWFTFNAARQIIRQSVINLVKRWFGEINEVVLIFETLIYMTIVLIAFIIFAQGLRLNLVAIGTSLGIGGVAVAFASQQALGRLFGTLELYLDRPYVPGEYIRVTFNPFKGDIYGRIESIGLRSTKIRVVARNTVMIVPNSMMAGLYIENISRGGKIMAMLCLDFVKTLKEGEKALVKQIIEESSQVFWELDKASTQVQFDVSEGNSGTRARIIFFITGSGENSIGLRKRLLELANDTIARRVATYNLSFTAPDPIIYIDSPMSI